MRKKSRLKKKLEKSQKTMQKGLLALTLAASLALPLTAEAKTFTVGNFADLQNAATNAGLGDTISFKEGVVINGSNVTVTIANSGVTIVGNGAVLDGIRLSTSGMSTISGITGVTMQNSTNNGNGGAIFTNNSITGGINNSVFSGNTASMNGGAIRAVTITGGITNSVFTDNEATNDNGGAIFADTISGGINNSVFSGNEATNDNGGAIFTNNSITGGITGSLFTGNQATNGGAINTAGITGGITNSVFINNDAGTSGGAIYYQAATTNPLVIDSSGRGVLFQGNTANGAPNSIHFDLSTSNTYLNITGTGTVAMYDPLSASGANRLFVDQTGGTWILGGDNNTGNSVWNISSGTLVLTDDSPMTDIAKIAGTAFTLGAGATLAIAPNTTAAEINTTNTTINGKVTVGTDERYRPYTDPAAFGDTLLKVNGASPNNSTIKNASGTFGLGQYDYTYDGLRWDNRELKFNVRSATLSHERNGVYAANGPLRSVLANGTSRAVFGQMDSVFRDLRKQPPEIKGLYLTEPEQKEKKKQLSVWGTFLNNNMKNDPSGNSAGSSVNTPGLIIGTDKQTGKNSFIGGAVSATWPDYKQGALEADGKDIRIMLYGGTVLASDWELGYMASAGKGNMSHKRKTTVDTPRAKYDISNYTLGLSLAKPIEYKEGKTLRPYLTYEYIRSLSDGYTENSFSGLTGITANGQSNTLSRVKLGVGHTEESRKGSRLGWGLYWQGLFGDRDANITSFMNSNPGDIVSLSGTGMDRSALGLDLSYIKTFGKTDIALAYNGLVGSKSMSSTYSINFTYKF